jgi:hypothetical protein
MSLGYNDTIFVMDKNYKWTMFDNIRAGSMVIYHTKWYTGSSDSTGTIHLQDVTGTYTDAGVPYTSYYTTKAFDAGVPANEKVFNSLWVTGAISNASNLNISYRLNDYSSTFQSLANNLALSTTYLTTTKVQFPFGTKGYYIQLKFSNSTSDQYFNIKGLNLIVEPEPLH